MTLEFLFWFLMFFWVLTSAWMGWQMPVANRWGVVSWTLIIFLLFLLIGLKLFGAPIK